MAKMEVHAGDFKVGSGDAHGWGLIMPDGQKLPFDHFESAEVASEESVQRSGLGLGLAGGVLLGGVGAVAGVLLGRKQAQQVTFTALTLDGRRLMATVPAGHFVKLQAQLFQDQGVPTEERRRRHAERQAREKEAAAAKAKAELRSQIGGAAIIAALIAAWYIFR
ncbi:hypothetical protein K6V92_02005 [Cupriavidus respiraculi]|uniref:hypothetical protein n=1 Tax=Cupriavidus respiraculi TaxID=195930 RepID=UPI001C979E06|nr:hypothetical protein [Cupriavidus respiraculi]MBY4945397.1 hypothetical protein [Cupriavidus respiraculi]